MFKATHQFSCIKETQQRIESTLKYLKFEDFNLLETELKDPTNLR